jgi:hypothetical protein
LLWVKFGEEIADSVPVALDGPFGGFAQKRLEFRKGILDGVEIETVEHNGAVSPLKRKVPINVMVFQCGSGSRREGARPWGRDPDAEMGSPHDLFKIAP